MSKKQLALAAEQDSLIAFRDFIVETCQEANLSAKVSYDIRLAVEEVCTNIIEHGYEGMNPGTISISFQYGTRQVVIRITDYGHPFEPSEPPEPKPQSMLEESSTGGLGLHFIYRSVDSVNYEVTESGNTLTLVKKLGSS